MEHDPQTITVIGGAEAGARVLAGLQAQHVSFTGALGTPVYVSDGMRRPDLSEMISPGHPEVVKGISGISPATEPTSADWYTNAFNAYAPGVRDLYGAYAYDCVNLLALAAQVAGTDNPAVFRADLVPVSTGGQTCRDFSECLDVLREGRNIDLDGAFRPLDLDENGDAEFGTYDLFTFGDDGKDVRVRQVSTVGT
jgi:branched-chain amino acid transport system substrate-binding protein